MEFNLNKRGMKTDQGENVKSLEEGNPSKKKRISQVADLRKEVVNICGVYIWMALMSALYFTKTWILFLPPLVITLSVSSLVLYHIMNVGKRVEIRGAPNFIPACWVWIIWIIDGTIFREVISINIIWLFTMIFQPILFIVLIMGYFKQTNQAYQTNMEKLAIVGFWILFFLPQEDTITWMMHPLIFSIRITLFYFIYVSHELISSIERRRLDTDGSTPKQKIGDDKNRILKVIIRSYWILVVHEVYIIYFLFLQLVVMTTHLSPLLKPKVYQEIANDVNISLPVNEIKKDTLIMPTPIIKKQNPDGKQKIAYTNEKKIPVETKPEIPPEEFYKRNYGKDNYRN